MAMDDAAPANSLSELAARAAARFDQRYAERPQWIVAAPGRVNLIGEHVDYNDGFVLPMAIDRYCVIAAGAAPNACAKFFSIASNEGAEADLTSLRPSRRGHWSNYVFGVVDGFVERDLRPAGFRAVLDSNVPVGGGLSSSAALEVATAILMEAMAGAVLDPIEKALLCQKAEHEFAGVPCGIMDQFASVMCRQDHVMLLDCRSRQVEHIPLADPNISVLIVNTNVKHALTGGEYGARRAQCESAAQRLGVASLRDARFPQLQVRRGALDPVEYRRAKHVLSEIGRTLKTAAAIKSADWNEVGRLMYASHDSLRDDYEVSCPELDLLVDLAREIEPKGGVLGSRMTGGGFGGCTVSLIETAKVATVAARLLDRYRVATQIEASAMTSRPARGAHVVLNYKDATK